MSDQMSAKPHAMTRLAIPRDDVYDPDGVTLELIQLAPPQLGRLGGMS